MQSESYRMKNALRATLNGIFCLGLGLMFAACSSNAPASGGSQSSDPYSFTAAPTVAVKRVMAEPKRPSSAPPLQRWQSTSSEPGGFVFDPHGGQHGAGAFVLTGDGAPPAKEVFSPAIHVAAGKAYAFSAWLDSSKITSGPTYLWVSNASRNRMYFKAKIAPKQVGRFEFTAQIPDGVHEVTFGYYTNGCRLAKGDKIVFAAPMARAVSK